MYITIAPRPHTAAGEIALPSPTYRPFVSDWQRKNTNRGSKCPPKSTKCRLSFLPVSVTLIAISIFGRSINSIAPARHQNFPAPVRVQFSYFLSLSETNRAASARKDAFLETASLCRGPAGCVFCSEPDRLRLRLQQLHLVRGLHSPRTSTRRWRPAPRTSSPASNLYSGLRPPHDRTAASRR